MAHSDQFPLFRLATLLARQMSAPLATRIKEYARSHPRFGSAVCMRTARVYAAAELRFKLWSLHMPQPQPGRLPPLPDTVALNVGADIIGEVVIFALGALIIVFEVNRQAENQEAKVVEKQAQWDAALATLDEMQLELARQQHHLDRLHAVLQRLQ